MKATGTSLRGTAALILLSACAPAFAQVTPHNQDRPPNPAKSPEEAMRAMTLPPGFSVELVASEPDLVNPVAMTFDERGRIWVTESLEYPRRSPGVGRDRVKVLEDTDGDGKADRFTVFAEGLNIPSGIAVGQGGVWVANSPDVLFLQDTDGDGKADRREVVVSGFGRDDTHELPNSLCWGPDGWLYGWNGVFNPSHVRYRGKTYDFTCAIFRIHPKTRDFELFCEGTSNPWGIAWDVEGNAFASACVIDHLWHLTETGYYHRQGGPYPPFTWKIESIVEHKHQKAAYCGIHYYDSDAYPPAYRGKLFMGNIHGNAVNFDSLRRNGSTYVGTEGPDFLQANDAWFMPVSQRTGPDGCLYVLDWYDRYHCYQDANRDPAGIDRLKGRLYRIRYNETPRRVGFDLSKKSETELIQLLASANGFDRETARRLLTERESLQSVDALRVRALDGKLDRRTRLNALWVLVGRSALGSADYQALLSDADAGIRAWGVRAAGNAKRVAPEVRDRIASLAADPSPDVQLQVAVAARKVEGIDATSALFEVASRCGNDVLIPHIVWQNLLPLLGRDSARFGALMSQVDLKASPALSEILVRAFEVSLASGRIDADLATTLFTRIVSGRDVTSTGNALKSLTEAFRETNPASPDAEKLRNRFRPVIDSGASGQYVLPDSFRLASAYMREPKGMAFAREVLVDPSRAPGQRLAALEALVYGRDAGLVEIVRGLLARSEAGSVDLRGKFLAALGSSEDPALAPLLLGQYESMEAELKPRALELLTQRTAWALPLLQVVESGRIPAASLNPNQIRKLASLKSPEVASRVTKLWGTVREQRDPRRERVIDSMRNMLSRTEGNPVAGAEVFKKLCAQCHKLFGEGQDVGPDITLNGRNSYEQLLSNVFDPSLVIGSAYQGTTVATADGRVLTGLLAEDSPQRITLKLQGGKVEVIPRGAVAEVKVSALSLMPEDVEKQLQPQEIADLFAYITLDRPPTNPAARPIPGAEKFRRRIPSR